MYARVILRVRMWLLTVFPRSCSSSPWQGRMFSGRFYVRPSDGLYVRLSSYQAMQQNRSLVCNLDRQSYSLLFSQTVTQTNRQSASQLVRTVPFCHDSLCGLGVTVEEAVPVLQAHGALGHVLVIDLCVPAGRCTEYRCTEYRCTGTLVIVS